MVGDGKEVEVVDIVGVCKGLFNAARAVGDVGVRVQLAEIQVVAVKRVRRPVGEGVDAAGLVHRVLDRPVSREVGNGLYDERLTARRGRYLPRAPAYSQRFGVLGAACGRVAAVNGVINSRALHRCQRDGVASADRGATDRRGQHHQPTRQLLPRLVLAYSDRIELEGVNVCVGIAVFAVGLKTTAVIFYILSIAIVRRVHALDEPAIFAVLFKYPPAVFSCRIFHAERVARGRSSQILAVRRFKCKSFSTIASYGKYRICRLRSQRTFIQSCRSAGKSVPACCGCNNNGTVRQVNTYCIVSFNRHSVLAAFSSYRIELEAINCSIGIAVFAVGGKIAIEIFYVLSVVIVCRVLILDEPAAAAVGLQNP